MSKSEKNKQGNTKADKSVPLINKIKDYATEVIAGRKEIRRLSKEAEQGRKEGGIRNVEASLLLATGEENAGRVKGREAQQQVIEDYAKRKGIWHDNVELNPEQGKEQYKLGIFKDSGAENQFLNR